MMVATMHIVSPVILATGNMNAVSTVIQIYRFHGHRKTNFRKIVKNVKVYEEPVPRAK